VEKVKRENGSIRTDTAEEHVPHWSLVLVMYKLGSLTIDEVTGVSYLYHFVPQQNKYSNGIFWSCF